VVAGVAVTARLDEWPLRGVRDSKALGTRIPEVAESLRNFLEPGDWCVLAIEASEVEAHGLQDCWDRLASAVVRQLTLAQGRVHDRLVVDGSRGIPGISRQKALVRGDREIFPVAAASILAKDYRDALMAEHPLAATYGWGTNRGYATRHHLTLLREHGLSLEHRPSPTASALRRR